MRVRGSASRAVPASRAVLGPVEDRTSRRDAHFRRRPFRCAPIHVSLPTLRPSCVISGDHSRPMPRKPHQLGRAFQRVIPRMMLFLMLGAIINVAVAWACAIASRSVRTTHYQFYELEKNLEWEVWTQSAPGAQ